jgi:hypothetical protein
VSRKPAFLSCQQGTHLSLNAELGAEDTFSFRQTVDCSRPVKITHRGSEYAEESEPQLIYVRIYVRGVPVPSTSTDFLSIPNPPIQPITTNFGRFATNPSPILDRGTAEHLITTLPIPYFSVRVLPNSFLNLGNDSQEKRTPAS